MSERKRLSNGGLTRRAAWEHLERAFSRQQILYGKELIELLERDGAPIELVDLLRPRVSSNSRFAGPEALRRHVRLLPSDDSNRPTTRPQRRRRTS